MMATIDAVYEDGVFRPMRHIALKEGTHVNAIIPQPSPARAPKSVAAKLADIAAKVPHSGQVETTSEDHSLPI